MAFGNITQQIALLGKMVAEKQDAEGIEKAKLEMVLSISEGEPFMSIKQIGETVNSNIGYLAGYLPVVVGNEVLKLFQVEHPVFGSEMPEDLDTAFEAGKRLGKEWLKMRQAKEEMEKKVRKAAELGVALPDGDETVSNSSATEILHAIRAKRASKGDKIAAEELEDSKRLHEEAKIRALKEALESEDDELMEDDFDEDEEAEF